MNDFADRVAELDPKRLRLLAVELRSRLDALERDRRAPVAVVGIGCRLPGADGPDALWRLLRAGADAITEVPPERFDADRLFDPDPDAAGRIASRWGGFPTTSSASMPTSSASLRARQRAWTRSSACSSRSPGQRSRTPGRHRIA
jgi:hypothetical protein